MAVVEKKELRLHRGFIFDLDALAAYEQLLGNVLGIESGLMTRRAGVWTPFALFEPGGRCVANVDAAVFPLVLDGIETRASGIRSVAVDPAWRGQGLFRDLMIEALAWCRAKAALPTFLFTAEPTLYRRFGFTSVPQHAFAGPAPAPLPGAHARRLDALRTEDRNTMSALVERRVAVSSQAALGVDAATFLGNVGQDDALVAAHSAELDALILYEVDDEDDLTVVDIVSPAMPTLATVLGALALRPKWVKVLFPPDRIGWVGEPVPEDTGLMIAGAIPGALTRPFTFPPTAEF